MNHCKDSLINKRRNFSFKVYPDRIYGETILLFPAGFLNIIFEENLWKILNKPVERFSKNPHINLKFLYKGESFEDFIEELL